MNELYNNPVILYLQKTLEGRDAPPAVSLWLGIKGILLFEGWKPPKDKPEYIVGLDTAESGGDYNVTKVVYVESQLPKAKAKGFLFQSFYK